MLYQEILKKLNASGYEAYLVGGSVRDTILNKELHDFDIATNAPEKFIINELKGKHISKNMGICVFACKEIQVAQYRHQEGRDSSLLEDARCRDFTINAIYLNGENEIVDPFQGKKDLENKILRCVENPIDRFNEDSARLLRAIRFAICFDLTIEEETKNAIIEKAHTAQSIAGERILLEFEKISQFGNKKFAAFIRMLDEYNLLEFILPEIKALQGLEHKKEHHPEGDAFEHTLKALENISEFQFLIEDYPNSYKNSLESQLCNDSQNKSITEPKKFNLLMAILLHDCGKALTYNKETLSFHGHDMAGFQLIENIAKRLKFSNEMKEQCLFVCANHMKMHFIMKMQKIKVIKILSSSYFSILLYAHIADVFSRGMNKNIIEKMKTKLAYLANIIDDMSVNHEGNLELKLAISGDDLLKLQIKGKKIGETLFHLKSLVAEHKVANNFNELIKEVKRYKKC